MSRVVYVSQYFVRADQPGGVRHWQHAQALARAGHDVTVITSFVQHKTRAIPPEYAGRRIVPEIEDGLRVIRTYSTPGYGRDLRSRLSSYASFAWWSGLAGARDPRPDIVVASSPTLPAAAAAAALARARGARFVLEVRDLWPESAIAMGLLTEGRAAAAARRLERFCYRRADRIIALTEGIRDGILAQGVAPGKIALITNGIDLDIGADARPVDLGHDRFVAMYVGAHGTYGALDTLLDAAATLAGRDDIELVLVGDGDRKASLVERAARDGLMNVRFVDSVPKREVAAWLARADASVLPYQDLPIFAGALPNKIFDYLAAGAPVIAAAPPGEVTDLIARAGCGVAVPAEDGAALAAAIAAMADDRAAASAMGARGHAFAREHYDRRRLAERFVGLVESVG